ncbi:MAG: aminoacetone oxidase family FAD-binding enzyme [Lachnospiraceae bacterium]|nr:aminoacetone oxidase family FAD-binding enzyme [Lachnospiraceae bacterium]
MKKNQFDTIIIGAGASGLFAAIEASSKGGRVLIIERMKSPGKKILATGNGKCNLTNLDMKEEYYRGSASRLALFAVSEMPPDKLRRYFYRFGLNTIERNGYVYPVTEQAKTVVSILLREIKKRGVLIHLEEELKQILPAGDHSYQLHTDRAVYKAKNIVLSCGGCAYPSLGSNGSGYAILEKLKIAVTKPLPALTALCTPKKEMKSLSGVRTKGALLLICEGKKLGWEKGEVQFTNYGISGIPVFSLSRFAVNEIERGKKVTAFFDFYPEQTVTELRKILRDFRKIRDITVMEVLEGLVHEKWCPVLLKEAKITAGHEKASSLPEKDWDRLLHLLKEYPIPVNGYRDFDFAQVSQGGVKGSELTNEMEVKKYQGLYLTGEIVDVDGICGGYNLTWAFASGYLAGRAIASKQGK